jgi:hypothetical protein
VLRLPRKLPIGVLTAEMMYTSCMGYEFFGRAKVLF